MSVSPDFPTVSVLLDASAVPAHLAQTLDSLLAQRLPPLEILVLRSEAEAPPSMSTHGPLVVDFPVPPGLSAVARYNRALTAVRGDYMSLCEAGHLYHPELLAKQVERFCDEASLGALFARFVRVDQHNQELAAVPLCALWAGGVTLAHDALLDGLLREGDEALCLATAMFPAAVLRELSGFDEAGFGDGAVVDLYLRVARFRTLSVLDEPLVRLRSEGPAARGEGYYRALEAHMDEAKITPEALALHHARMAEDRLRMALSRYAAGDGPGATALIGEVALSQLLGAGTDRLQRAGLYSLARGLPLLPSAAAVRRFVARRIDRRRHPLPFLNW